MANINFNLKTQKADKNGKKPIILIITHNNKRYRKQIDKTKEKYWSNSKQRVLAGDERYEKINTLLNNIESKTKKLFDSPIINNIPLTDQVINQFLKTLFDEEISINLKTAFQKFIDNNKATKAKWTIKGYETVLKFLKDFEQSTGTNLEFYNVNLALFEALAKYAFDDRKTKKNYFAKIVSVFKTFLNWCNKQHLYNGNEHKEYVASGHDIEIIYLSYDELLKLYAKDFKNEKLNRVRDLYCFACFTGLRFSDLVQLKHEHIKNGWITDLMMQKTKKEISVPLIPQALEIIEKYKEQPVYALPRISHQKANDYIKDCCEAIDLKEKIIITEFRGANTKALSIEKFNLITMHTARKTFITNSFLLGMDTKIIKSITGHSKDSSFDKYLKIEKVYKQQQMLKAWGK